MTQKDSEVNEQNKPHSKDQPDKSQDIVKTSPEETKAGSDTTTTPPDAKTGSDIVKTPPDASTGTAIAKTSPDAEAGSAIAKTPPDAETETVVAKTPPDTEAGSDTARVPRVQVDQKKEEAPAADNGNEKSGPDFDSVDPSEAHVLVVEDNVPNFVLIARMLAYMGVQRCEWKTSGWQVVEFADTLPRIDLILMDIRLPYEDGFQALQKVRSNPRLKDTLVVAVTAEASVEQMRRAKEAGFDGFLGKPLDPDRFPDQVRRVLSGEPVWEIH
jgi:two-component system cell cycle response regulator DivK